AVPAHRLDHLLPDVIDGVCLSLSILPVTDEDIFRLCGGATLAIDETEIAHPAQDDIARFTRRRPVRPGRKPIRTSDDAGQSGAFHQRHLARRFIEITGRGRFGTVVPAPEVDAYQL